MNNTDFLTVYAADRMADAHHHAWADSLRPSYRERFARSFQNLAARIQPDLASTTTLRKRRAL